MKIKRDRVFSLVTDLTGDEDQKLRAMLEFEEGSLITDPPHLGFYTGLVSFLSQCGFEIDIIEDASNVQMDGLPDVNISRLAGPVLREYQQSAVRKAIYKGRGIVQAPTGSGKTVISASTIAHLLDLGVINSVLYLCPQGFIAEQTANRFMEWGLPDVCTVGYGHRYKPGAKVYVCVVDSAYKRIREESTDLERVDLLMLDEAHHAKAARWTYICERLTAPRRLAFTATAFEDPKQYCYDDLVLQGLTGPIISSIDSKALRDQGYLAYPTVCMLKPNSGQIPIWSWNGVYKNGIVLNKKRNSLVVSVAKSCYVGGHRVMVFVGQVLHGEKIASELSQAHGVECVLVQGNKQVSIWRPSGSIKRHKWCVDEVAAYINNREKAVMIATTVLDEGFDVPTVDVLIMATAMKKYRRTIQRAGRGMRPKKGTNRVFIFDFYDDNHVFLENHSKQRIWTYNVDEFEFVESLGQMQEVMGTELELDRSLYYKRDKKKRKKG